MIILLTHRRGRPVCGCIDSIANETADLRDELLGILSPYAFAGFRVRRVHHTPTAPRLRA